MYTALGEVGHHAHLRSKPAEYPTHRRGQRQVDNPEKIPKKIDVTNDHDRRRVHFLLRRQLRAQLVPDFRQKRAAAIPPARDVLARFSMFSVTALLAMFSG
jgi:hypothetical protein